MFKNQKSLSDFLIVDINTTETIEKYAEIDAFSQGKLETHKSGFSARNMGKKDLWIASTASVYKIELLTTDKDFEHLKEHYIKLNVIDLKKFKSSPFVKTSKKAIFLQQTNVTKKVELLNWFLYNLR